jgi:K319-like protein
MVDAGPNQTIGLFHNTAPLDGTVTDDGLPSGTVTSTWIKVSGPGTVTFGNGAAVDTTASFSLAGTYVLRLTADDGALSTNAQVTITYNDVSLVRGPIHEGPGPVCSPELCQTVPILETIDQNLPAFQLS